MEAERVGGRRDSELMGADIEGDLEEMIYMTDKIKRHVAKQKR